MVEPRRVNGASVRQGSMFVLAIMAVFVACASIAAHAAQSTRVMVPDDLKRLRPIWMSSLSPDGRHVAMIVGRDPTIRSQYFGPSGDFALQCDVWIAPTAGGEAINVTQSDRNGATHWKLEWSPKGTRLVAMTTQGASDRVRLMVWTAGQKRGVVLPKEPVYAATKARRWDEGENAPVGWLNEDELLFVAVGEGHDATTMDIAPAAWRKTMLGKEVSSSVLESGKAKTTKPRRWSTLKRLHIPSGRTTALATIPPEYQRQTSVSLVVSPTGKQVAVIGDIGPNVIPVNAAVSGDSERRSRIAIVPTDGSAANTELVKWLPGVAGPQDSSVRWSPKGSRLAFFGKALPDEAAATDPTTPSKTLFVLNAGRTVQTVSPAGLRVAAAEWVDEGRLFLRGSEEKTTPPRDDWWLVDVATGSRNSLTSSLPAVPATLVRLGDGRYAGIAKGAWIALDANGATMLQQEGEVKLRNIVWPKRGGAAGDNALVAQAEEPKGEAKELWYRVDIDAARARVRVIEPPAPNARFVGFNRSADGIGATAFAGATEEGTFVWVVREGQPARPIFANNAFIAQIKSGERRLIQYRSADGTELKAALLLPPGYQEGTRIPVMVWVYGGTMIENTKLIDGKHGASLYNGELFAAKGVAMLHPSIPLSPNGSASGEPVTQIAQSVLPAVDRLIEMGIADTKRVGVGGTSYGAYSTYSLLTQTSRFRAAIATDGDSDLLTSYTALDPTRVYLDGVHEVREGIWWAEASQGRMGQMPWRDPLRYIRNSPFFALDRIDTPLLIVHCDLDYVPIAHAERMFVGLERLGKTVRFVRYFGEKHGPYSPANLQDLWQHMYRWMDEYLLPQ